MPELADMLDEIAGLLEEAGDSHWACWLRQDAANLRRGDAGAVDHFLSAFGGMGSINDTYWLFVSDSRSEEDLSLEERIGRRLDRAARFAQPIAFARRR